MSIYLKKPSENEALCQYRRLVILVSYDVTRTVGAIKFIKSAFKELDSLNFLIVFNNSDAANSSVIAHLTRGWWKLMGSNEYYEFSAWQEGLEFFMNSKVDASGFYLINDTVVAHRVFSIFRLLAFRREVENSNCCKIVGFTNNLKDSSEFHMTPYSGYCWISTYLFYIDILALKKLDMRIFYEGAEKQYIQAGFDQNNYFSRNLSNNLRDHLSKWLFCGGWYGSQPLNSQNADFLYKKSRSIIFEKLLTLRALHEGVSIVDGFEKMPFLHFLDRIYVKIHNLVKQLYSRLINVRV